MEQSAIQIALAPITLQTKITEEGFESLSDVALVEVINNQFKQIVLQHLHKIPVSFISGAESVIAIVKPKVEITRDDG